MERLNKIKGAIFDLDGTLLDSMDIWESIDEKFFKSRRLEMPPDYMDVINPMGFAEAAEYTIKRFGFKDTPQQLQQEWHKMSVDAYAHDIKLKLFAKEYLYKLKNCGVKLGVATALNKELYVPVLKNNGIYDVFDAFTSLDEVSRGKGYPDIYLLTAQKLKISPCECAVFEDIFLGIKGANDGGFLSVAVYDKHSDFEADKIKAAADLYVSSFETL